MTVSPASRTPKAPAKTGRRSSARLRLAIPARLLTTTQTQSCVLLDLSRKGARISLEQPIDEGEAGFLRVIDMELFVIAVRKRDGVNGLEFEHPLGEDMVLAVRRYSETYEAEERLSHRGEVRAWVTGGH